MNNFSELEFFSFYLNLFCLFYADQLKIEILDVNDCKPMFLKNISMKVMENLPIKSLITRVSATDADKDDKVTYKLKENYAQFEINKTSGKPTFSLFVLLKVAIT